MSVGVAIAATASLGLVSAVAATAISAPHVHKGFTQTARLNFVVSKKHFTMSGPTTFSAGSVAVKATGAGKHGGALEIVALKAGYTYQHLQEDLTKAGSNKSGLRHFNNAIANTTQYGGLAVNKGQKEQATINLTEAGSYYAYNDTGSVPTDRQALTVTGSASHVKVKTDATVKATGDKRWRGDTHLPAKGTITFKNISKGRMATPNYIYLDQVKKGTTRKEVLDSFQNDGRTPFALPGEVGTDAVSDGGTMTFTYHTHPGDYVLWCFFPDLKTGVPYAFAGMVRIVHLS